MGITRFEDIKAWQIARELTCEVYSATVLGAFARDFGLRDQITRAAGSVMHNIAEGFDSDSDAEFARFLGYAKRSATELQSQLYVALDQEYINNRVFEELYEKGAEVRAAIHGFIKYLKSQSP
jgi:four helix bundle protein